MQQYPKLKSLTQECQQDFSGRLAPWSSSKSDRYCTSWAITWLHVQWCYENTMHAQTHTKECRKTHNSRRPNIKYDQSKCLMYWLCQYSLLGPCGENSTNRKDVFTWLEDITKCQSLTAYLSKHVPVCIEFVFLFCFKKKHPFSQERLFVSQSEFKKNK